MAVNLWCSCLYGVLHSHASFIFILIFESYIGPWRWQAHVFLFSPSSWNNWGTERVGPGYDPNPMNCSSLFTWFLFRGVFLGSIMGRRWHFMDLEGQKKNRKFNVGVIIVMRTFGGGGRVDRGLRAIPPKCHVPGVWSEPRRSLMGVISAIALKFSARSLASAMGTKSRDASILEEGFYPRGRIFFAPCFFPKGKGTVLLGWQNGSSQEQRVNSQGPGLKVLAMQLWANQVSSLPHADFPCTHTGGENFLGSLGFQDYSESKWDCMGRKTFCTF